MITVTIILVATAFITEPTEVLAALAALSHQVAAIAGQEDTAMKNFKKDIDTLTVAVQENSTVVGSATLLLNAQTAALAEIKAQLIAAGTDTVKLAELRAAIDAQEAALRAATAALAAGVAENTPAEG